MGTNTHTPETIGSVPHCPTCNSQRVVKNAWACFNPDSGLWELEAVRDDAHCHQCNGHTTLLWTPASEPPSLRVRDLNDRFRTTGQGNGTVLITHGVQAQGDTFLKATMAAIQSFADFGEENDPWGEHDFGAVDVAGQKVFFKFDYYDPTCTQGSENPANEALTHRVLTIMLAGEY